MICDEICDGAGCGGCDCGSCDCGGCDCGGGCDGDGCGLLCVPVIICWKCILVAGLCYGLYEIGKKTKNHCCGTDDSEDTIKN